MVDGRFAAVLVALGEDAEAPRVSWSDGRLTVASGSVEDRLEVGHSREIAAAWRLTRTVDGEPRWEMASEPFEWKVSVSDSPTFSGGPATGLRSRWNCVVHARRWPIFWACPEASSGRARSYRRRSLGRSSEWARRRVCRGSGA